MVSRLHRYKLKSQIYITFKFTVIFFPSNNDSYKPVRVCTFNTYKPGLPEMANIFLNSCFVLLLKNLTYSFFILKQISYQNKVLKLFYLPFLQNFIRYS
jgi:hypothetical protein